MSGSSLGPGNACAEHNPLLKWCLDTGFDHSPCCFCSGSQLPEWKKEFVFNSVTAKSRRVVFVGSESPRSRLPLCSVPLCTPPLLDSPYPAGLTSARCSWRSLHPWRTHTRLRLPVTSPRPFLCLCCHLSRHGLHDAALRHSRNLGAGGNLRKAVIGLSGGALFSCLLLVCCIFRGKPTDRTLFPHVPFPLDRTDGTPEICASNFLTCLYLQSVDIH